MYTPRRDTRPAGNRKFGKPTGSWNQKPHGRDFGHAESFEATCGNCGKACRVPFRPNGKKPVLCTNCFKKEGHGDHRDSGPRNFAGPTRNGPDVGEQLRMINAKLDTILKAIESAEE